MNVDKMKEVGILKRIMTRRISLRGLMVFTSCVLSVLLMLVLTFVLYNTTKGYVDNKLSSIHTKTADFLFSGIQDNINEINNTINSLQSNSKVIELVKVLEDPAAGEYDKLVDINELSKFLININEYSSNIYTINLMTKHYQVSSGNIYLSSKIQFDNNYQLNSKVEFHYKNEANAIDTDNLITNLEKHTYYKFNLSSGNYQYGNYYMLINDTFFDDIINSTKNVAVFDKSGDCIFNNCSGDIDTSSLKKVYEVDSGKYTIYARSINYTDWTAIYMADKSLDSGALQSFKIFLLLSFLGSILCSILISGGISKSILKPFTNLNIFVKGYHLEYSKLEKFTQIKSKKAFSLREKIFFYLIMTVLIPVVAFLTVGYIQIKSISIRQITDEYNRIFNNIAINLSDYLEGKSITLKKFVLDSPTQNLLVENQWKYYDMLKTDIVNNYYLGLENNHIHIYGMNDNLAFSNSFIPDLTMDHDYVKNMKEGNNVLRWFTGKDRLNNPVITIGIKIMNVKKVASNIGYGLLVMDYKDIYQKIGSLENDSTVVFIADGKGNGIVDGNSAGAQLGSLSDSTGMITMNRQAGKYILYYRRLSDTPWYIVAKYDYNSILKQSNEIITQGIYLFIIGIMLIIVISFYISFAILKPINKINYVFRNYNPVDYDSSQLQGLFIDEIEDLAESFNHMVDKIEDLLDELVTTNMKKNVLEIEKKNSELVALQAQINPHFLYNTLDNIIYMVRSNNSDNAIRMIDSLSKLFRYGISRKDTFVTIREEIAYAKAYVDIMSFRHDKDIRYQWDVHESILNCMTIKLILQPIIENAIYHGFEKKGSERIIIIRCWEDKDLIKFMITDNGDGIETEKLKKIIEELNSDNVIDKIGIYNVQSRIRLQYGKNYGLAISSTEGKGTAVKIEIPKNVE